MRGKAPRGLTDGLVSRYHRRFLFSLFNACLSDLQVVSDKTGSSVTASLYVASSGYIVCGHQDGSIVLMVALQAAISQLLESSTGWKSVSCIVMCCKGRC